MKTLAYYACPRWILLAWLDPMCELFWYLLLLTSGLVLVEDDGDDETTLVDEHLATRSSDSSSSISGGGGGGTVVWFVDGLQIGLRMPKTWGGWERRCGSIGLPRRPVHPRAGRRLEIVRMEVKDRLEVEVRWVEGWDSQARVNQISWIVRRLRFRLSDLYSWSWIDKHGSKGRVMMIEVENEFWLGLSTDPTQPFELMIRMI